MEDRTAGFIVVDLDRSEVLAAFNTAQEALDFRTELCRPGQHWHVICDRLSWDDAIHISAPWEPRSALCGNWRRNLIPLTDPRPDALSGCWTCLMVADWLDTNGRRALVSAA